jgi:AraC-like DNA-binding protein
MDALNALFTHFSVDARVFYSGNLCSAVDFSEEQGLGYLHVLRRGKVRVIGAKRRLIDVNEPSLMLVPRAMHHRFEVDDQDASLVCATIDFGGGSESPLLAGLPDLFLAPLSEIDGSTAIVASLFNEAFGALAGRQSVIDRLTEYCLILLLRHAIDRQRVNAGALAGLADARLKAPLMAIHDRPEYPWTLEELAGLAAMSRARFAAHFRATVNTTPHDYVTTWRICVARVLLKKGMSVHLVAPRVGYASASALSKVFSKKVGCSPGTWLARGGDCGPTRGNAA